MNKPLNIIFAGTPDFAANHLAALLQSHHHVVAVYSQPDRPAGRGKKLQASAVKQLALQQHIPVYQPASLKSQHAQSELANIDADIMVVVAYGLILPKQVLNTPRLGCLNVHGSLLPKWRGAAPIQRAIWAGDQQTGVTIMQMDEGLDTGAMLYNQTVDIDAQETSASLYEKLAQVGPQALLYTLDHLHELSAQLQDEQQSSYAAKLSKQEALLDWQQPAQQLARNVRAFNPWPVCYMQHKEQAIKVWKAQPVAMQGEPGSVLRADRHGIVIGCAQGALNITELQIPGKKAMSAADILNARQDWFVVGQALA